MPEVSSANTTPVDLQHRCTSVLTVDKPAIGNTTALMQSKRIEGTKILSNTLTPKIKGSLKRHISFWRETLKANSFILSTIEHGYKIPFRLNPPSLRFENNKSALKNKDFVQTTIFELLRNDIIYEINTPYLVSPLSVAENSSGKKRFILDLSYLNEYVWKEKIKFDDWKIFEQFVDSDNKAFLFKFDLKKMLTFMKILKNF